MTFRREGRHSCLKQCLKAGMTVRPSRRSWTSSRRLQRRARVSSRWRTGSPRSTMTARCGWSSRCHHSSTSCSASGPRRSRQDPSLATQQPYKAIIEKDPAFFEGLATQDPEVVGTLLKAFARSWAGTTPEEFEAQVREWLKTVKQPKLGKLVRRSCLQADAGAARLAEGSRLPGVCGLWRWPGLHAGVRRGDLGHLQGERDRHGR